MADCSFMHGGNDISIQRLADGRRVGIRSYGKPDGIPVIALHGTPGSGLRFRSAHPAATALGVRLIAPDRWGYGQTDVPARAQLADYGSDLAEIATSLAIDRFAILGVSGGGPFAAMAAARLGSRVSAVGLVCPVGPLANCPLPGTSPFHRVTFRVVPRIPGANRLAFAGLRLLLIVAPDAAVSLATARAPTPDRLIMSDTATRTALAEAFAAGLTGSADGPVIDMKLFATQWSPAAHPATAARVWIGTADGNISVPAARFLASILDADCIERPGEGHYWIANEWRLVLGWLAEQYTPDPA